MQPTRFRGTAARPVPAPAPRPSPDAMPTQEIAAATQEIPPVPAPAAPGRAGRLVAGARRGMPWTAVLGGLVGLGIVAAVAGVALRTGTRTVAGTGGAAEAGDLAAGNAENAGNAAKKPSPSPVIELPSSYTIPGTGPHLPWPGHGQSAVAVSGLGTVGSSGSVKAVPIASVTKVMTAYVVLHDHPLDAGEDGPNLTVTVAEAAAYPTELAQRQSLVPVRAGEVLTEREALEALLLPSADNVAQILARWDGGRSTFVSRMNSTAARLGMTHTRYTDPSGLSSSTKSTAVDQVLLGQQAMTVPALAEIVAMSSATIPVAGKITNYNTLLGGDGFVGIKTGSTSAAGGCLLFAARQQVDGHEVLVVGAVLGQPGSTLYGLPGALSASDKLVDAVGRVLAGYTVITAGQLVAEVGGTRLVAERDVTVIGWPGRRYQLKADPTARTLTITPPAPGAAITIGLSTG